ncbi:hypothetical protein AYR56_05145 [Loigolactobacillus backii]|uniref:DZANK-type domain-containing protein n=1 Tax=Loigolactobacillus backii TaxID=375175 RepID=A0A192H5Z1_9LACO|nr:zinc-ribbon domain-containing protein [Loigolactobacillus backii]ANK63406.1 hypothetical protein AYR53_11860 [Loigolactobacillus backii]ANK69589.1 hypothetical protein AYR56_05145 [Loigolactobacillus backii]
MNYCQKCGNKLDENVEFCPKCGQEVLNIDQVATKFCSNCGKKIPAASDYCPNCGVQLKSNSTQENSTKQQAIIDKPYNENKNPDPINSIVLFFKDTFHVSKRLGRADYWWARLTAAVVGLTLSLIWITAIMQVQTVSNAISSILTILLIILTLVLGVWWVIASITADIRRLHDVGISGAFLFLLLLPSIGNIVIFVMTLLPSKQINNRYAN